MALHSGFKANRFVAGTPMTLDDGSQVPTEDVAVGDVVSTAEGDPWAYNLTIADTHTYYVGDEPLLVHNASCPIHGNALEEVQAVAGRLNTAVLRNQAPKGILWVDRGRVGVAGDVPHVHVSGGALNYNGTVRHGNPVINRAQRKWLESWGWRGR